MESLISFVVRKTPARSHRAAGQQLQNPFKMTACALERFASLLERFPSVERSLRVLDTGLAAMHVVEAELHHPGNGSIIHHKTCLWHQDRFLQHALVRAAEKAHFLLAAGCWGQSYYLGESKDNMAKRFWFLRLLLIFSGIFPYDSDQHHYSHSRTVFGLLSCILLPVTMTAKFWRVRNKGT